MAGFTKEQAERARNADLSEFLLRTDPEHYKREGSSIRLYDPTALRREDRVKSVSIKMGASWYHDFKTGESGNAVKYLTDYMNYNLVDAIKALAGDEVTYQKAQSPEVYAQKQKEKQNLPPAFPKKTEQRAKQMYGYLCNRGIPADTITQLAKLGLLYQSQEHNNLVFINGKKDFAEIRGTYTFGDPFHGVVKNRPDRFWSFAIGKPEKAYVCESAIDAISLYTLKQREGTASGAVYVSIAGVENQQSIDRIKAHMPVVIAVDNDVAGQKCRDRNPDCESIIPVHKDWNEDLMKGTSLSLDEAVTTAENKAVDVNSGKNTKSHDDMVL